MPWLSPIRMFIIRRFTNSMRFAGTNASMRRAANWTAKPKRAWPTVWNDLSIHRCWSRADSPNYCRKMASRKETIASIGFVLVNKMICVESKKPYIKKVEKIKIWFNKNKFAQMSDVVFLPFNLYPMHCHRLPSIVCVQKQPMRESHGQRWQTEIKTCQNECNPVRVARKSMWNDLKNYINRIMAENLSGYKV